MLSGGNPGPSGWELSGFGVLVIPVRYFVGVGPVNYLDVAIPERENFDGPCDSLEAEILAKRVVEDRYRVNCDRFEQYRVNSDR